MLPILHQIAFGEEYRFDVTIHTWDITVKSCMNNTNMGILKLLKCVLCRGLIDCPFKQNNKKICSGLCLPRKQFAAEL